MNSLLLFSFLAENNPAPLLSWREWCALVLGIAALAYVIVKIPNLLTLFQSIHEEAPAEEVKAARRAPLAEQTTPSKANGLNLASVGSAPPRESTATAPTPTAAHSTPPAPAPAVSVGPGEFEKALAHAGQRMDALTAQAEDLNRQLKLADKARTEAMSSLRQSTETMARQLEQKDIELAKLTALLDQRAAYPSLRALIEVRKLTLEMLHTKKQVAQDELVHFISGAIDEKLTELEVQAQDFPPGTVLDKIPGDLLETPTQFEATNDPSKANSVARSLRPSYHLIKDGKKIVVAKAVVVLYRLPPAGSPSSTPASK